MVANWLEGTLLLSPENERDEQALSALAEACTPRPSGSVTRPQAVWHEKPVPETRTGLAEGNGA
jgi:hypothetical protein